MFNLFKKRRKAKAAKATVENVQPAPVVDVVETSKKHNAHAEKAINLHVDSDNAFKTKILTELRQIDDKEIRDKSKEELARFYQLIKDLDEKDAQLVKTLKFVSVRGRTAWSICCLENALEKFAIYNDAWEVLLTKMWEHTQFPVGNCTYLEAWALFLDYLAPGGRPDNEFSGFKMQMKYTGLPMPTQNEYELLQQTLKNTNNCLAAICRGIYETGTERLWGGVYDVGSQNSDATIEIIEVMRQNGISLPSVEPFVGYEYIEDYNDEFALGPAFDGTQYSKFIKKNN